MLYRTYLFDTSAFRSISYEILKKLCSINLHLYASSYCFWEIITHIDEEDKFRYIKSNLMKFQYIKVLDDAYGTLKKQVLINDKELQEQITDKEIILSALVGIQESSSLKEFYDGYVLDSKGSYHLVNDISERARNLLKKAELKYVEFVSQIIDAIKNHNLAFETEIDRYHLILQLIDGEVIKLVNQGADEKGLRTLLIKETYFYYSYILHQSLTYLSSNGSIDHNDYEDAKTCFDLKLSSKCCFIVEDIKMQENIKKSVSLIKNINEPKYSSLLCIRTIDYLERITRV